MHSVLIINPAQSNPFGKFSAIEPPIIAAMYAEQARNQGYKVYLHDCQERPLDMNDYNPDEVWLIAMGANPSASSTPKMTEVIRLSWELRHYPLAIGGLHALALPQLTKEQTGADYILPPIMGKAAWDLLPMSIYRAHNWHCLHDLKHRDHYAVIYTAYGCPFSCDFCNVKTQYHHYTARPVNEVADEIEYLVTKCDVKNLKIADELFTIDTDRVVDLCDRIKDFKLNIWAYARVGTVNEKMLKAMKQAGINWLAYGFESFSEDVRKGVNKKFRDEDNAILMTTEASINIMGNFIFGLEGDTLKTMQFTLDRAMLYLFDYINFYVAMPYPGSKIWHEGDCTDWSRYSQFSLNPYASKVAVDFRNKAYSDYFSNPDYQKMIEEKFGLLAKQHLRQLAQVAKSRIG